jgi:tetratricopeptide (TPR) repeat protein
MNGRYEEAAKSNEILLGMIDPKGGSDEDERAWCNVAVETAELYLRLATEATDAKKKAAFIASAQKFVKELLWKQNMPVFFGRAIAMKAHLELLKGSVAKAQATIDDYMEQLAAIHKQIEEFDPDGRLGALRQSPMPQCRYLLADMLWQEAQAEYGKKTGRDDERVKDLMFGEKKNGGKGKGRTNAGAFNHAINVFVKYPQSTWASKAGELAKTISAFAEQAYGAKIKTNISPEQEAKVRAMQFKNAKGLYAEGKWQEAIDEFFTVLADYPEVPESIDAVEKIAGAYLNMIVRSKDKAKIEEWRTNADAVEGYLAERFCNHPNQGMMTAAGDGVIRLAAMEQQFGDLARADALKKSFLRNYTTHVNAPTMAASMAGESQKNEKWREAAALWQLIDETYPGKNVHAGALLNLSACLAKLGDTAGSIAAMKKYTEIEKNDLKRMQVQMNLAMTYQKDGMDILASAETNDTPEAVEKQLTAGSAQIIRGINQFAAFAKEAGAKLSDPSVKPEEKAEFAKLREAAVYLIGVSYGCITKPEAKVEEYRKKSAAALESYVKQYPAGQYAKTVYGRLGTLYTVMSDVEGAKNALARLREKFPDSEEAKLAKPRLAKNLVEYAKTVGDEKQKSDLRREASQIYTEMIRDGGPAYGAIDLARAGESLIEAHAWSLADEAFDKAIAKASQDAAAAKKDPDKKKGQKAERAAKNIVAKARLGKAKTLFEQKNYMEARESLDQFLDDQDLSKSSYITNACFLMIQVAKVQGRTEKDEATRKSHFGAANKALKSLRSCWSKEPDWKQATIDLMSADVKISQIEAEEQMGLDDAAKKTRGIAAASIQSFIQSKGPTKEKPIDKFSAQEADNLEAMYAKLLPLLVKMGKEQAGRALAFAKEYQRYFPNGANANEVKRCIEEAKALGAVEADDTAPQDGATPAE